MLPRMVRYTNQAEKFVFIMLSHNIILVALGSRLVSEDLSRCAQTGGPQLRIRGGNCPDN